MRWWHVHDGGERYWTDEETVAGIAHRVGARVVEYVPVGRLEEAVEDRDALAGALAGAAAALELAGYKQSAEAARAAFARYGGQ